MTVRRSLVVPVYGNEVGIPALLEAVGDLALVVDDLEAVFVVDGSPDRSYERLREALPDQPFPSRLLEHSRNFGAFAAVRTGMEQASGDAIAVMAADLQEPPELVEEFFRRLDRENVDIVFGVREGRRGDRWCVRVTSALYWRMYRRYVVPDVPDGGVDVFACRGVVRDEVLRLGESNSSLIAQLFWVGFRRDFVPYTRREREHGRSGWTTRRRLRYMADSIFTFSDLPVLLLLWTGLLGLAVSAVMAVLTVGARLIGAIEVPGFATLVVLLSFLFSLVIATQGVIGMYLWRAFENTKDKPMGIVMSSESFGDVGERPQ